MLIIGAGGFALECLEIFFQNNYKKEIYFFDNVNEFINPFIEKNYKVIRSFEALKKLPTDIEFILGIGNPNARKFLANKLTHEYHLKASSLISEKSIIGKIETVIGNQVNIMSGAVITSQCHILDGALINLNATIGHNSIIEQYAEICPGVNISGNCIVKEGAFIGTGANILPGIIVGKGAVVAAGSVVTKNVIENTMVAGNPAIFKKEVEKKW
jgi:sugar O-acyltransferase (sialic acid O-acetyltransferase NeuD family)